MPVSPDLLSASPGPANWELVYFAHPACSGTCAHCWSAGHYLGRTMPLEWHRRFWRLVDPGLLREVRLTGGEPLEGRNFAQILDAVSRSVHPGTPVRVLTSGRPVVSRREGNPGLAETVASLGRAGLVKPGVEICMSADEHHTGAVFRREAGLRRPPVTRVEALRHNELGLPLLLRMVSNFLGACRQLVEETGGAFRGGRLKVHVEEGRLDFHRTTLFGAFSDDWWDENVDWSEGLIGAGRAREWPGTLTVGQKPVPGLFIIPGAEFKRAPEYPEAQAYKDATGKESLFLDRGRRDGDGACVLGFWNLVSQTFVGGSAVDALRLIGRPGSVSRWPGPRMEVG